MYDVVCSGGLSSDGQYKKKVHIAYDSLVWKDECDVNVLVLCEPPSIIGDFSDQIRKYHKLWDIILTWREELLDLPNAQKFVFGCCWIDWDTYLSVEKLKTISFNTSDKGYAPGHELRQQIYAGLEEADDLNGFAISASVNNSPGIPRIQQVQRLPPKWSQYLRLGGLNPHAFF